MGWFLFIDESGQDRRQSPYEVLAGLAIEDRALWPLIQALKQSQEANFGIRLFDAYGAEAKGQKLLKSKTFKLARQKAEMSKADRARLSHAALTNGANVSGDQLTALGQSKLAYVDDALRLCQKHKAVAFASIIPNDIERPNYNFLRKDYTFLFERFFHFLNAKGGNPDPIGTIIFDEIEKTQSQILIEQMEKYFLHTSKGKTRSRLIVPEPFFVHSDLTTMIQMADLVAYIVSWGVRLTGGTRPMTKPKRNELSSLANRVCQLRYHAKTPGGFDTWGFKVITELRVQEDL